MEVSVWPDLLGRSPKSEDQRVKCFQVVDPFVVLQIAYWLNYLEFSLT